MKTRLAFFTLMVIAFIGCSKGPGPKEPDSKESNTTESNKNDFNINGTYDTDFGDLALKEDQKKVTGTYSYSGDGGVNVKGTLKGDLNDKTLAFTWEQTQGDQKSGGSGSFTFSDHGKSYTGTWSDSKGGTGPWNGTKK